jgi:hypothetical protein
VRAVIDEVVAVADDDVVPLAGGAWSVWRDVLVRSTGFPVDGLEVLGEAGCARTADRYLAGEAGADEFDVAFDRAARRTSARIHRLARDPLLREAITWQNRSAMVTVDTLVEAGGEPRRNARHRARERMLVRYWQRYCAKAETVGFFGPVCWARFEPGALAVRVRPGPALVTVRATSFEHWPLAAFADRLAADPAVRAWLPPVVSPQLTVRGGDVLDPVRPPIRLTAAQAVVVARCDGRTAARQIAQDVVADPCAGVRGVADAYFLMEHLVRAGILRWDFDLPVGLGAEQLLRERIERIGDDAVRAAAVAELDVLSAGRQRVAAAAGDADRVAEALAQLDDVVAATAGVATTRRPGEMYAGRTLCVQDTTRDVAVDLGGPLLAAIAEPLGIVLTVTRWLCGALAGAYLTELERLHGELAAESAEVSLGMLWFLAQDAFYGAGRLPATAVTAELRRRWRELFGLDETPGPARLTRTAAELDRRAAALFPEPGRLWAGAHVHSPDLQVCAADVDAVNAGRFTAVLGEMHAAWPAASTAAAVDLHPEPERLRRALRRDWGGSPVHLLLPLDWPRQSARLSFALEDRRDTQLGFCPAPGADPDRLIPISAIRVRRGSAGLEAVLPDGRGRPVLEMFGRLLSEIAVESFKAIGDGPHTPRITVDRLVVARESWRTTVQECPVACARGERAEYLAARRWRAQLGLPELVFVKLGREIKPLFLDLGSPAYVSVLAAALRGAAASDPVTVTEMLPAPDGVWLPDAAGRRYVSELRLHIRDDRVGGRQ